MPRKFRLLLNPRPACGANAASSGQQLIKTNLKYSNSTCIRSQAKVHPQFTRNYTPQNGIISPFSALSSISVLPVRLLRLPWKWRNSLRLRSPESEGIKFVPGKARRNDMYRAYMESKQRSRTHILCLLTVFLVNWGYRQYKYLRLEKGRQLYKKRLPEQLFFRLYYWRVVSLRRTGPEW